MNLYQFINTTKQIVLANNDVNTFNEGDVYEIMNSGQHTYPATVLTINNITTNEQSHYQTINCVLFYIDRLTDDYSNKTMIMSQGFNVLKQIKDKAVESLPWTFETANYTPYTEKFGDLCAGVYLECTIELEDDVICSDTSFTMKQLEVTSNGLYSTIGYDTVFVDVPKTGKIQIMGENPQFRGSMTKINGEVEFPEMTSCGLMFADCKQLEEVPLFDTSKVTDMGFMFNKCASLTTVPLYDTSNVYFMAQMFLGCANLVSVPQFDTSNVRYMLNLFGDCNNLTDVPLLDASKVESIGYAFVRCYNLTNFGGLKNIGQSFESVHATESIRLFDLSDSPKLTDESVQNIIDNLYDMHNNPNIQTATIKFNSAIKLTDEQKKQITDKNWTVAL